MPPSLSTGMNAKLLCLSPRLVKRGEFDVKELLENSRVLPVDILEGISRLPSVDVKAKKLFFASIVYTFIWTYLAFKTDKISQRLMARLVVRRCAHKSHTHPYETFSVNHRAIGEYLRTTDPFPFRMLLQSYARRVGRLYGKKKTFYLAISDGTFVTLPSKRFKHFKAHMKNQHTSTKVLHVQVSISRTYVPRIAIINTETTNDNTTFGKVIDFDLLSRYHVHDKGVSKLSHWKRVKDRGAEYITRLNEGYAIAVHRERLLPSLRRQERVLGEWRVIRDVDVTVGSKKNSGRHEARVITIRHGKTGETLKFLTSDRRAPAWKLALYYKERWTIEVFIRFLKSNLGGFEGLVSTSENGIEIQTLCLLMSWLVVMALANVMTGKTWIEQMPLLLVMVRKWLMDLIPPALIYQLSLSLRGNGG